MGGKYSCCSKEAVGDTRSYENSDDTIERRSLSRSSKTSSNHTIKSPVNSISSDRSLKGSSTFLDAPSPTPTKLIRVKPINISDNDDDKENGNGTKLVFTYASEPGPVGSENNASPIPKEVKPVRVPRTCWEESKTKRKRDIFKRLNAIIPSLPPIQLPRLTDKAVNIREQQALDLFIENLD